VTGEQDDRFRAALAQVLRPLARVMIGQSVPIAQATELLKQAYVSAALRIEEGNPTDSRISLLTGIHRKDVKRLRDTDPRPPRRPMLNATALVLAIWTTDPQFSDEDGTPLPLSREGDPSFDDLIKKARIDLPASTLLAALIEHGVVTQPDQDGPYQLVRSHLAGAQDDAAMMMAFEKNVATHLEATADNLSPKDAQHFERGAHFNQLSAASVARLEEEAGARLQEVLVDLNARALRLQEEDIKAGAKASGRFSLGAYVYGQAPKDRGTKDD